MKVTRNDAAKDLITLERQRQISIEGWSVEHDDEHQGGELLSAARVYREWETDNAGTLKVNGAPVGWPWDREHWKPKNRIRNLVRGGALALAEIERCSRAGIPTTEAEHELYLCVHALESHLGQYPR